MRLASIWAIGSLEQHYPLILIITDCYVADRADSLLTTTDRCKSENLDRLLSTVAVLTPSIVIVWANDGFIMKDGAVLHP
jgi:hypothetical protein